MDINRYKICEFSHGSVQLNDEQYCVVTSPPENQRIVASAGSGKTTTITSRIAYLVEEYGMNPSSILLLTFSRAAAKEMIERVYKLIGPVSIYAGTFHGLSGRMLRESEIKSADPANQIDPVEPFIDELPYMLVKWLRTDEGKKLAKRFRTIIVDEFQDINKVQWEMIMGFYHANANITIVGDDAQNIYTWRGSSVNFILDFHTYMKNVKDYQLCKNYRSTEAIVTIANSVMRLIPTLPFKEKMIANTKGGRKPEVHFFFRSSDECDWIVNSLDKMVKKFPALTFAVLSRYNSDLYKIEERLHCKGVKYSMEEYRVDTKITLATIHSSKGLEWDIVFFMNLHDDIFPSRKGDEDIICERRLFYVGVTRAKKGIYMTYSRQERSLSRFVREIPRPFLRFFNVTSFKLSTSEATNQIMSVDTMINGLDGEDWNRLREDGYIPNCRKYTCDTIYKFGQMFLVPEWVRKNDVRETWYEMMKLIVIRECAIHHNKIEELRTPEINESLLTIRIYKEDIVFWEEYETELEHLVHTFFKHTQEMPPLDYVQLDEYVKTKLRHINWSVQEMCHALIILAKIRGQLRPMRHMGFDLNEFSFGLVSHSVPTELRPEVLASYYNVVNAKNKSHDILGDLWRIASMKMVSKGRNVDLYKYRVIYNNIMEHKDLCIAIEDAMPLWSVTHENPTFHFMFTKENVKPIHFDMITDKCAYFIFFDPNFVPTNENKILLLLKQYLYDELFDKNDKNLESMGFLNIATGMITQYEISSSIHEQLSHLWRYLQMKYQI